MKRSVLVIAAVLVAGCARPQYRAPNAEVALTVEGRVRGAPIELDAGAMRKMEQRTLRVRDPWTGAEGAFEGTSLDALIRELDPRRGVDLVVVHGQGGYTVAIPLPAIRQHGPILAERAAGRPLAEALGEDAGRLALVWPNVQAPGFDEDPRTRWWWPRGVTRIELVPWFETYGRALSVPAGSSDQARRGADAFATSCIHCHQLRGAGGKRGPDLSAGVPAEDGARFAEAVRAHDTRVPGLNGVNMTRGRLPEITAFLTAVSSAGPLEPRDASAEPEPDVDEPLPGEEQPPVLPPMGPMNVRP